MDAGAVFRSAVFPPFDEAALAGAGRQGADGRRPRDGPVLAHRRRHSDRGAVAARQGSAPGRRASAPAVASSSPNGSTIPTRRAPTARRARTSPRALPGLSLVFAGAPNAFGYGLPPTAEAMDAVLEGIPLDQTYLRIDAHPLSRVTVDWLVAADRPAPRRPGQAQPLLRHRPGRRVRRHRPLEDVDRGAAGLDAAVAGAFLRARRARRAVGGRRPRLPQCGRDRGRRSSASCWPPPSRISECSRRRARR